MKGYIKLGRKSCLARDGDTCSFSNKINLRSGFSFNDHSTRFGLELHSLMSPCFRSSQGVLGRRKSAIVIKDNTVARFYRILYIGLQVSSVHADAVMRSLYRGCRLFCT